MAITTTVYKYALTLNHSDFYQIKTASAFAATVWLV